MRLGLREANQKFAQAIRAVRGGQDVVLTDRGQPLAVIRLLRADDVDARLDALATEGLVRPALRAAPMGRPRWRPEPISGGPIAETVRRDRDETA
jgi:antitoxin (DNA-binding transcriptional repressor) of toxin-antitoxin stability system